MMSVLWIIYAYVMSTVASLNASALAPDLLELTVDDIITGFAAQQFSSVDLVRAYTARIAEVQQQLRPVLEINPEAEVIAKALDGERLIHNTTRGPLHGVPVLLKDNIGTADLLNTSAGSYALFGSIVSKDSTAAANLRAAGAVILGKAGMSEWAWWRGSNNPNGWSGRGGQGKGAYAINQDPCGSSSGSGVAASLGLATLNVGSDTAGSIICPSDINGVVGIRPSTGLISRSGVVPISHIQDTLGPITGSVKDAALLLTALAGPKGDPEDNYTNAIPSDTIPNYASHCILEGLQGARLGIPRNAFASLESITEADIQQIDAFDAIIPLLQRLGATVIDNANYPDIEAYNNETQLLLALNIGMKDDIVKYLSSLKFNPTGVKDMQDLLRWTKQFQAEQYPLHNANNWEDALASPLNTSSPEWLAAVEHNRYLGSNATIQGALDEYNLDALVLPTTYVKETPVYAGYPSISVPLGFYNSTTQVVEGGDWKGPAGWGLKTVAPGIPFGISFIGPRFGEQNIIQFAYAFEQATLTRKKHRPLSQFIPKTQLGDIREVQVTCPDALGLPKS